MPKVCWLVLGLCAVLTYRQMPAWASDLELWTRAAAVSPLAPRPMVNVAREYIARGQWPEAEVWAHRAEVAIRAPERARERAVVRRILDQQYAWIDAFSPSH
jgi:hypothetical protein